MRSDERSEYRKCYDAAFTYAAKRRRSSGEIKAYLRGKSCKDTDIEDVLSELGEISLVNDFDYCKAWIADRLNLRPRSKRMILAELASRLIDRCTAEEAIAEIDNETYYYSIRMLIEKKRRGTGYTEDKLREYLYRQGYLTEEINQAFAGD